jgi:hypothetical protein
MKLAIKAIVATAALCAFAAPAFAYTISGTIPGNSRNMTAVHFQKPPSTAEYLKLTLSAPPANVGVGYSVGYCISRASAPASQPCSEHGGACHCAWSTNDRVRGRERISELRYLARNGFA